MSQKRPMLVSKEAYASVKRGRQQCQKRPMLVSQKRPLFVYFTLHGGGGGAGFARAGGDPLVAISAFPLLHVRLEMGTISKICRKCMIKYAQLNISAFPLLHVRLKVGPISILQVYIWNDTLYVYMVFMYWHNSIVHM